MVVVVVVVVMAVAVPVVAVLIMIIREGYVQSLGTIDSNSPILLVYKKQH
jgi:hypothetical protein